MGEFGVSRSATEEDKKQAVIEGEYAEAVTTARAYLQAVGVLDANGRVFEEDEIRKRRECEDRMMRAAILSVEQPVTLPRDPNCEHAIKLAMRYRRDVDPESLAALLRNQNHHRSYQVALDTILGWLETRDFEIPDKLRDWGDSGRRERPKSYSGAAATRNHLIGMVVEAMAQGTNFLYLYGDSERGQLQKDLNQVYANAGNPPEGLPTEAVVEALNKLRARWRDRNDGEGLTEADLSELLKQPLPVDGGVVSIMPETEVRESFPNLYATRNEATADQGRAYSICDAVAEAMEGKYETVKKAWLKYRQR